MAHQYPTVISKPCTDGIDLEKGLGLGLATRTTDEDDGIRGLSSPTTTAVDNGSECKASIRPLNLRVKLIPAGSDEKSESSSDDDATPYIITKSRKSSLHFILYAEADVVAVEQFEIGYPLQAAFQASESCFSIYRSFGYLHSRVILELQDEIRLLEDDLASLDKRDFSSTDRRRCVKSREIDLEQAIRDGKPSERARILEQIHEKLVKYDEILIKARELNAFQKPSSRDYSSLRAWFDNEEHLSSVAESEFVRRKEDLITLRQGREWAGFDGWVESSIKVLPKWMRHVSLDPRLS
jgi:hypothetical protein